MNFTASLERQLTPLQPGSVEEYRYRQALEILLALIARNSSVDQKIEPVRTYEAVRTD